MEAKFTSHREYSTSIRARGVPATEDRPAMPDYIRLEIQNYPFSADVLMDVESARLLAAELLDAALVIERAERVSQ